MENGEFEVSRGPVQVGYRILRRVTDRYTSLVEGIQRGLDTMEDDQIMKVLTVVTVIFLP